MDLKNIRVLVVDDSSSIREALSRELEDLIENVVIETACNGEEALDILKTSAQRFDVVISDLCMTPMDGLTLFRVIKDDSVLKKTPFILMTGAPDKSIERSICANGGQFLAKPFDDHELIQKIGQAMGKFCKDCGMNAPLIISGRCLDCDLVHDENVWDKMIDNLDPPV